MANVPANPRLWNMLLSQARQRFRVFPSLAASNWVHKQYVQDGGRFVDSEKKVDPKMKEEQKDKDKGKK